jgi:hypothetical protein
MKGLSEFQHEVIDHAVLTRQASSKDAVNQVAHWEVLVVL